ncbi:brachyurin-like [Teleopsis dalmanni]|uniref:brachyurin-like n=1 Tax=Teleopsis dalmanni TaxID=139649 RepID=UPI000D32D160|nr:brachyurin-like [Teleopsis dalmanni]
MKFALSLIFFCIFSTSVALELGHLSRNNAEIEERIAGGDLAHENQFPYQAGLSIELQNGFYTWCGGSIIDKNWLLTAAHCVENVISITVNLGSTKRLEPKHHLKLTPAQVILHTNWNNRTLENDIALLHLPTPLTFNESIFPINLPRLAKTYSTYAHHEGTATGWGKTNDASPTISEHLRYVTRFVESNAECQFFYGASVHDSNICIDTTGGQSTCTGDSGGPLVTHDSTHGLILIGLTSFGKSSGCTKGYPAVFTRITSHLDWIQKISGVAYF